MTQLPAPALSMTLAALIALGAAGCDFWPSSDTGAKDAVKPAQTLASLPPPPAAAPPAPAAPAPLPPARMTNAQQADFESWIVRTYLGCWKPPAQPADSDPYVARVRLAFKPDGSLAKAPKLVNPPSDPALKAAGQERHAGRRGLQSVARAGPISPLL